MTTSRKPIQHALFSALVAAALAAGAATQASAQSFIALTRPGNFTFGPALVMVPIAPGVFQTPVFFNAANQRFIVSYTAECAVAAAAGNTSTWVDLTIRVVNVGTGAITVLPPTVGGADAFCTSNGTAADDGWVMAAVNAVGGAGLPAGNYVVQVQAALSGAGTGHLGDSSLIVWR